MLIAIAILFVAGIYISIGVMFAVFFVVRGIAAIDDAAHDASWAVRLLLVPASVALWPLLWQKWAMTQGVTDA